MDKQKSFCKDGKIILNFITLWADLEADKQTILLLFFLLLIFPTK